MSDQEASEAAALAQQPSSQGEIVVPENNPIFQGRRQQADQATSTTPRETIDAHVAPDYFEPPGLAIAGAYNPFYDDRVAALTADENKRIDRLADFFDRFFQNTGTVATFGASITFALIVSQLQDPVGVSQKQFFDLSTVRILIAVSWFLFTILLGLSFLLNGWVQYKWLRKEKELRRHLVFEDYAPLLILVYAIMIGAFICLSLVVAAYVDAVGFLATALVSLLGVTVVLLALFGRKLEGPLVVFQGAHIGLTAANALLGQQADPETEEEDRIRNAGQALPVGWTAHKALGGRTYYVNAATDQISYARPERAGK